ncbi:hypothetical protein IFM89_004094 [Coptis chinensis]|uniref:Peptidase A1 domain-containing protein n=1 Tax=Coptis chinensis TaxID=261450 RepID=A0A835IUM7_9MAGN|nr:hypothetical protein IFM89_004094 [Coptis chinensis]
MVVNMDSICQWLFLSTLLLLNLVVAEHNGFSIRIIHRDSPESPLYPGNLTLEQRLERLHNQINDYVSRLASVFERSSTNRSETTEPTWISPPVAIRNPYFIAIVGLGTFEKPQIDYKNTYLMLDTGTSVSEGYLGGERFTFNSDDGATESVNLVFGCGFDQKRFPFGQGNPVTGILGLGYGPHSLLNQLGARGQGRMSYCVPLWREEAGTSTFLRFGQAAQFKPGQQIRTTPLIQGQLNKAFYYVELLDISVAGSHIHYLPEIFAIRPDGNGGTILDTGSPLVLIRRDAYTALKNSVEHYFSQVQTPPISMFGLDLCYSLLAVRNVIDDIGAPTITFHFGGADLEIKTAFVISANYLCMTIIPHDYYQVSLIIGSFAQSNYRFLINVGDKTVSFAEDECGHGS